MQGDVGLADDVRRAYDEAMRAFGKVDIVINNAGTSRNGKFEALTDEILQEDLDQKLFAAIRLIRLAWPQMKERRWGRIINVLNIGAKAARPASMPTSVSRAAGMALTKALAGEGGPHNILVNALLVGFIESDQHVRMAREAGLAMEQYSKDAPRISRSAAPAAPRSSPTSPASSPPMPAPTSPAPRSMSTAAAPRWCRIRPTEPYCDPSRPSLRTSVPHLSCSAAM